MPGALQELKLSLGKTMIMLCSNSLGSQYEKVWLEKLFKW